MAKRFISIWFPCLKTDWFIRRQPALNALPFVAALAQRGHMVVTAANMLAQSQGIYIGMPVADARAMVPLLPVLDDEHGLPEKFLKSIAEWCIRFTPAVGIDMPAGLILDVTGCTHLWGGEEKYLEDIIKRFRHFGYHVKGAMASTIGAAWAIARFGQHGNIVEPGGQSAALLPLPPGALRIEAEITERLEKLGLRQISSFISMPPASLRRRFGSQLLQRLHQATGSEEEWVVPVQPIELYQERLACLEPIVTAKGIEIALQRLLENICHRLQQEQKGLRTATFKGYRIDGKIEAISIGTSQPSSNGHHLFKLFENKIATIEPALGIELFVLDAARVEELPALQEKLWEGNNGLDDTGLSELLDRIGGKIGASNIHRYVPDEHYWPERSFRASSSINEKLQSAWKAGRPRPLQLLPQPQLIEVTAPIPDYPPMLFRYKEKLHKIVRADGPERIEQEWWLQQGQHRDYYCVEDEDGNRYWLFRLGHYDAEKSYQWFIHGFFA